MDPGANVVEALRLLRPDSQDTFAHREPRAYLRVILGSVCAGGLAYGMVMGSFGGVWGERLLQVLYSGIKVPVLLCTTFFITLPSFFVLNKLLGLRDDFGAAMRAVMTAQSVVALALASLAPYTALWYATSAHYPSATLFNATMFTVASLVAQTVLRRHYRPLIAKNPRHGMMLWGWLIAYAFVGIQMGWMLRPFIGDPGRPVEFFRSEPFDNAYVIMAKLIWQALIR